MTATPGAERAREAGGVGVAHAGRVVRPAVGVQPPGVPAGYGRFKQLAGSFQAAFKQLSNSFQAAFKQLSNSFRTVSSRFPTAFKQRSRDRLCAMRGSIRAGAPVPALPLPQDPAHGHLQRPVGARRLWWPKYGG